MLLNCGVGEDSWESLGLQGDPTSPFCRRSALGFLWKKWCWSWNSSTLATSCKELTHWKRLWYWEGLGARREGDDRGWDGWMASRTRWTWIWVNSGRWWWTGRPGVLQFMGSQRVGQDWATELNWTVVFSVFLVTVSVLTSIQVNFTWGGQFGKHYVKIIFIFTTKLRFFKSRFLVQILFFTCLIFLTCSSWSFTTFRLIHFLKTDLLQWLH